MSFFYFWPLISILIYGFRFPENISGDTTAFKILSSYSTTSALWFSTWQASIATIITLLLSLPIAYIFAHFDFIGKKFLYALAFIPFVLPTIVVATAWQSFIGPHGITQLILTRYSSVSFSFIEINNPSLLIIATHIFFNMTIAVRIITDAWVRIPKRFLDSSKILGANSILTWVKVVLPLLKPSIISAALLIFLFNFTSFGAVILLGGGRYNTLEVEIYLQTIVFFNLQAAGIIALMQLVFCIFIVNLYTKFSEKNRFLQPIERSSYTKLKDAPWKTKTTVILIISSLYLWLVLPLLSLIIRALFIIDDNEIQFALFSRLNSLRNSPFIRSSPLLPLTNSIIFASMTAIFSLLIGLPSVYVVTKLKNKNLKQLSSITAMLPMGTSSITIGFGFLIALSFPGIDLRTSTLLLPIAHTLVAFPIVFRILLSAFQNFPKNITEKAYLLGATSFQVFFYIELPIISRSIATATLFAFAISIGEFGATALVSRPEFPTLTTTMFQSLSKPGTINFNNGLILGCILMTLTTLSALGIEKLRGISFRDF